MNSDMLQSFQHIAQQYNFDYQNDPNFDITSQLKLAKENKVPEQYKAVHNSYLARIGFITTSNEHNAEMKQNIQTITTYQSTRPAIEHGVAPDFTKYLIPTTIEEVANKVNYIHKNHVMFVKTIYDPYRIVGTNLLVEDENQDCIMLSVYNYVTPDENPKNIFPVGTHLAILDPYMKNSQDDKSKNLLLRCDNPQCILVYNENIDKEEKKWWDIRIDGMKKSSKDPSTLRKNGNEQFINGNLTSALDFYTKALASDHIDREDKIACLSNCAEVRLRQGRYEDATKDTQEVLKIQPDHLKAKFRLSKALAHLQRPSEAMVHLEELLSHKTKDQREIRDLMNECHRLKEEQNGIYDYNAMMKEATLKNSKKLHADFLSSSIEIGVNIDCPSGISYRGCKAVEAINEDELIMASTAFVYTNPQSSVEDRYSIEYDVYDNTINKKSDMQLVEEVVKLIWNRPCVGQDFYSLSTGDHTKVYNTAKIDLPKIRRIVNSNKFAQTNEDEEISMKWLRSKKELQLGRQLTEIEFKALFDRQRIGSGLWLKESLFNHSCYPNCNWTQIGKHMFIRTNRKVKKNEELCVSYCSFDMSYDDRTKAFARWTKRGVGFSCACERCHLFRTHPDLQKLDAEVENAYEKAANEVASKRITMASAAEKVISSDRLKSIMKSFAHLPLYLQHNTVSKLCILEGVVLRSKGDIQGALEKYQQAADIGYSTRGNSTFEYLTDLWRITGAAMACKKVDIAHQSLQKVWKVRGFRRLSMGDAKVALMDLTIKYSMSWWDDSYDFARQRSMEDLVMDVIKERKPSIKTKSSNRKRGNK